MNLIELIEAVRGIDKDAADYLENEAPKLSSYAPGKNDSSNNLASLFCWIDSVQGKDYWIDIESRLIESLLTINK